MATDYRSRVLRTLSKARRMNFKNNFDRVNQGEEPPPPPGPWTAGMAETRCQLDLTYGEPLRERLESLRALARAASYYLQPARYFSREYANEIARGEFLYGLLADER